MTRHVNANHVIVCGARDPRWSFAIERELDYAGYVDVDGCSPDQVTLTIYPNLSEAEQAMKPEPDYPVLEIHLTSHMARELADWLLTEADNGDSIALRHAAGQGWLDRDIRPLLS